MISEFIGFDPAKKEDKLSTVILIKSSGDGLIYVGDMIAVCPCCHEYHGQYQECKEGVPP